MSSPTRPRAKGRRPLRVYYWSRTYASDSACIEPIDHSFECLLYQHDGEGDRPFRRRVREFERKLQRALERPDGE